MLKVINDQIKNTEQSNFERGLALGAQSIKPCIPFGDEALCSSCAEAAFAGTLKSCNAPNQD